MPLDYMATGFSRWGLVVFRKLPYVLKKKKKNPNLLNMDALWVFFYMSNVLVWVAWML